MIQLVNISKQFADKILFDAASVHITPGEHIGIVGPNGTGKTTLLRMIRGTVSPDNGEVIVAKKKSIGYLEQDITETGATSVLEEILRGFPELARLEHRLILLEQALAARPDDQALLHQYGALREEFEQLDGYGIENRARAILTGVGISPAQHKLPLRQFSGGWMMRIALARLLIQKPDILLMDEPTNHLDLLSVMWLEKFLLEYTGTVLLISHDQYFLNKVATRIVEISSRKLISYAGNYEAYRREKRAKAGLLAARQKNQQKKVQQTERFVERFRYKATKARQVQSRIKQLEKMDRLELHAEEGPHLRFRFPQPARTGAVVAELRGVRKCYGDNVVYAALNLLVERGEKIALVGPNGAGKSTLLKILGAGAEIQAGERKFGHHVKTYYYAQHQLDTLQPARTILEELATAAPDRPEQWLRKLAGSFLFPGDDVFKKIFVLSGGERARVALAKMLAAPANFMVLDEPTNHLDMQAREILQQALQAYEGTMIFISHDRTFINAIATAVLEVEDGRLREYPGDFEYYQWKKAREAQKKTAAAAMHTQRSKKAAVPGEESVNKKDERRQRAEQRLARQQRLKPLQQSLDKLEADIAAREAEKVRLTADLCDPQILDDRIALAEKSRLLKSIEKDLAAKMDTWADLTERLEKEIDSLQRRRLD